MSDYRRTEGCRSGRCPTGNRHGLTEAQLQALCDVFNLHNKEGASVEVTRDDGSKFMTITTSEAWVMGGHSAMIKLRGISGGFLLERVTPL